MRQIWLLILVGLLLSAASIAQEKRVDLFQSMKVDVTVVVKKHSTGADMVELTAGADDFPDDALRQAAVKIGEGLSAPARGLSVFRQPLGTTAKTTLLKATFATNGILAGAAGIRLQPIARAFAGGTGSAQVQGLDIVIIGQGPNSNTLPSFESPSIDVQGQTSKDPGMLEYRIQLKSQDPTSILIPDRLDQMTKPAPKEAAPAEISPILKWGLVILAALATGALVYNLALRGPSRTQRR